MARKAKEKVDAAEPLKMRVRITLLEEALGTANSNPDIHREYIASQAPDAASREEEVEALGVESAVAKAMTVFPKDESGNPFVFNYQIKGLFKDACGMLNRIPGTKSANLTAYKKTIDGCIFVLERKIPITLTGKMGNCQRPLRAQTAQGERVALANSETIPAGSTMEFTVYLLNSAHKDVVMEWLDYGKLRGFGQWRNSGKGIFDWEEIAN